jgi:hypothetical protein
MRRAAEQMRNAASELQRQNAGGAAASGEKAAEALRQIERQLGGSSADAGQRTAGELQLEAQQIAEGQRRIAAETTRLEKDGQGRSADALRRLAAEKDKLASRVDELHRATRQAERDMPRASGAPFRDAAAELQGQQIGNRMRASAQQMRDRASTPAASGQNQSKAQSQAQTERQLSRALDSVVDKLGGSAPGDARRLTDQLDGTREMRDRLNRLEQQVRNAEAEARAARATQRGGSEKSSGQSQQPASDRSGRGNPQGGRQAAGATGSGGDQGGASQRLQQARAEYARELQRSRDTLGRLQAEQRGGLGGSTPEQHEYSRSAPGNEAFKQDFGNWEALRKDVDSAMEQYEAAVSARLARKAAEDRLSAGGSERVPDAYRPLVSRYFEAIAKAKK